MWAPETPWATLKIVLVTWDPGDVGVTLGNPWGVGAAWPSRHWLCASRKPEDSKSAEGLLLSS